MLSRHSALLGGAAEIAFCPRLSSVLQSLSHVCFCATPWTAARQASLSSPISWSLLKFMSVESIMPSNHLILCCPLLLLSPIPPSIRVFSSESTLHMRWPKYWSFSFSIIPSKEIQKLILQIPNSRWENRDSEFSSYQVSCTKESGKAETCTWYAWLQRPSSFS